MASPKNDSDKNKSDNKNGLDRWNTRLDENLEPSDHNDLIADEKAKAYSKQFDQDQSEKGES